MSTQQDLPKDINFGVENTNYKSEIFIRIQFPASFGCTNMLVTATTLGNRKQEDVEFENSLGHLSTSSLI